MYFISDANYPNRLQAEVGKKDISKDRALLISAKPASLYLKILFYPFQTNIKI
jgi:hypothetical protein